MDLTAIANLLQRVESLTCTPDVLDAEQQAEADMRSYYAPDCDC